MAAAESVTFQGAEGTTLAARIDRPADGAPRAWALFAHCFSCSKDVLAASRISARLAEAGFGVFRFDFAGLGESGGDFAQTTFSSDVADLKAAIGFMRERHHAPALLIGHSLGGAAVLAAAGDCPEVKAVATLAAPADTVHVAKTFEHAVDEIRASGAAQVELAGRPFTITEAFLNDIAAQDIEAAAAGLGRPLLVAHSPTDATVGIEHASRLFLAAKHPKSFISLGDADHLLRRKEDAQYAADVIAAWAARFVGLSSAPSAASSPAAVPGAVLVAETGDSRYQNHVVAGRHHMFADEPASVGGADTGPSPYEFLNAALGACTSMTVRMYAERKGWPVEKVSITLAHEKTHVTDCENCEHDPNARVDLITRTVTLTGDLSEEQRARLIEIADKCPVHRTLEGPVVIRTSEG